MSESESSSGFDQAESSSGFEEIGSSDLESINGEGDGISREDDVRVVDVIPELLSRGSPPARSEESSGATSSFVPATRVLSVVGELSKVQRIRGIDRETAAESSLTTWDTCLASTTSFAASSTTSEFRFVSVDGVDQVLCRKCRSLNAGDRGICGECGIALIKNPCPDIDAQIARKLQEEEDRYALQIVQRGEMERKSLASKPLFDRARFLAEEIQGAVHNYELMGVNGFGIVDQTFLCAQFIECFERVGVRVTTAYHFSNNQEGELDRIRRDGFGNRITVSGNIEAALAQRGGLQSIPETDDITETDEARGNETLGWIVATAQDSGCWRCWNFESAHPQESSTDDKYTLRESAQCLPLAWFDASMLGDDVIRLLTRSLSERCLDFFHTDWTATSRGVSGAADAGDAGTTENNGTRPGPGPGPAEPANAAGATESNLEDYEGEDGGSSSSSLVVLPRNDFWKRGGTDEEYEFDSDELSIAE